MLTLEASGGSPEPTVACERAERAMAQVYVGEHEGEGRKRLVQAAQTCNKPR
jgi:hypothetical protein